MSQGTQSGVAWLKLYSGIDSGLYIKDIAGFRLNDDRLRVFTHLATLWCKNGPPDCKKWQLNIKDDIIYTGSFTVIPMKPIYHW